MTASGWHVYGARSEAGAPDTVLLARADGGRITIEHHDELRALLAGPATVWIYVDDDGTLSPVDYATRLVAQAHAEAAWRFVTEDDGPTPLAWKPAFDADDDSEDAAADFDLIDEDSGVRTGWQVRRIRVVDEMPAPVSGAGR